MDEVLDSPVLEPGRRATFGQSHSIMHDKEVIIVEQRRHTILFAIFIIVVGMKVQLPRVSCIPISKDLVEEPPNDPVF